ncbi:cytidylate kinase family protein [Candidatus Micrarchaeota archaeon]|nr:cytidylate kinase family protein [Candidatus Micrarchaeota archaeon]
MIIAISGLTGSGKNTLGELLAKKLGYRLVCPTFKDLALIEGVPLMEFQERAKNDPDIDRKFDAALKEQAAAGNCVVTTWLGAWMVDADVRIKVKVADDIRAGRIAKRDGMTVTEAMQHIRARDGQNRSRYMKLYGIDIDDEKIFNAILDGGKNSPQKLLEMSLAVIKAKKGKSK